MITHTRGSSCLFFFLFNFYINCYFIFKILLLFCLQVYTLFANSCSKVLTSRKYRDSPNENTIEVSIAAAIAVAAQEQTNT